MMKNYNKHPVKLIITLLLTLFAALVFKNTVVKAATCESGQVATQYYTTSNTWSSYSQGYTQQTSAFRRLYTNANMYNADVVYTFRAKLFAPGRQTQAPTYTIEGRIGTGTTYANIEPYCNTIYIEDYNRNDSLIFETYWTITVKCTIPSTDSNFTRFRLTLSQPNLYKMSNITECTEIDQTPSDVENGVSTIQEDMYNYYSSLWEKSNISEEIILSRIQEAEEGITEAIEQQTDDILNGGTPDEDDTNEGDSTNTDNQQAAEEGLGTLVRNHGWSESLIVNETPHDAWAYIWGKIENLFSLSPYGNELDPSGNNNLKIKALFVTIMGIGLIKFLLSR